RRDDRRPPPTQTASRHQPAPPDNAPDRHREHDRHSQPGLRHQRTSPWRDLLIGTEPPTAARAVTPRWTHYEYLAPSPAPPAHRPKMSRSPSTVTPMAV